MLPFPRRRPSLAVVLSSAALGVALVGTVTSTSAAPSAKKRGGTIILVVGSRVSIQPGDLQDSAAKCPSGYSVIGGSYGIGGSSAYAHAVDASVLSKANSYSVSVVNPPANPTLPGSGQAAELTVAANCAKTGSPIVPVAPYKRG